jgi:hypothetical protein
MQSTSPQFFQDVYGTDYNQNVPVNLWRPQQQEIPLRTEHVPERNGMFRSVPESALAPGNTALFIGQSIHHLALSSPLVSAALAIQLPISEFGPPTANRPCRNRKLEKRGTQNDALSRRSGLGTAGSHPATVEIIQVQVPVGQGAHQMEIQPNPNERLNTVPWWLAPPTSVVP